MAVEVFEFQWMDHSNIFNQAIGTLRNKNLFTDATLACEGKFYPVHKFVLSTCSEYFSAIFEYTPCVNPVVVINNIPCAELEPLLDFMYKGEASVTENILKGVIKAAEWLCIKGLSVECSASSTSFSGKDRNPIKTEPGGSEPKKKRNRSDPKKRTSAGQVKSRSLQELSFSNQAARNPASSSPSIPQRSPTLLPSPINHGIQTSTSVNGTTSSPASDTSLSHPLFTTPQNPLPSISTVLPNSKGNLSPPSPVPLLSHNAKQGCFKSEGNSFDLGEQQPSKLPSPIRPITDSPFPSLKTAQDNLGLHTSLPSLSSSDSSQLISTNSEYSKYESPLLSTQGPSNENLPMDVVSSLPQIDQKLIGEEIHLDGPVKDLQISTEDGTVSIPEILEGLVEMKQLYNPKGTNPEDLESNDTSDSMYEFTEEFQESSMLNSKDKIIRSYSNTSPAFRRKFFSSDFEVQAENSRLLQFPKLTAPSTDASKPPSSAEKKEVKPSFACTTCSRTYTKKELLTRHLRTHTEYPYLCTVCSFKCKAYKELIQHRKGHADKHCDKCEFSTLRADTLRRHMLNHSEEKAHKCPYPDCSQSFLKPGQLKNHMSSHKKAAFKPTDSKKDT